MGSILDVSASPLSPHRRAKSLDRRSTESSMTVSHQGGVPCLGRGHERPFPRGPTKTGLLLLSSSQHMGFGVHSDLEQVQGTESGVTNAESLRSSAGEGPHFLPVAEIKTQETCEEHFSLKYSSNLGSRPYSGYFPLEYPISLMLCVMCQTLRL